jgi:hypothetical protein
VYATITLEHHWADRSCSLRHLIGQCCDCLCWPTGNVVFGMHWLVRVRLLSRLLQQYVHVRWLGSAAIRYHDSHQRSTASTDVDSVLALVCIVCRCMTCCIRFTDAGLTQQYVLTRSCLLSPPVSLLVLSMQYNIRVDNIGNSTGPNNLFVVGDILTNAGTSFDAVAANVYCHSVACSGFLLILVPYIRAPSFR